MTQNVTINVQYKSVPKTRHIIRFLKISGNSYFFNQSSTPKQPFQSVIFTFKQWASDCPLSHQPGGICVCKHLQSCTKQTLNSCLSMVMLLCLNTSETAGQSSRLLTAKLLTGNNIIRSESKTQHHMEVWI